MQWWKTTENGDINFFLWLFSELVKISDISRQFLEVGSLVDRAKTEKNNLESAISFYLDTTILRILQSC